MFGHQDVFRILGRDPLREPLTPLERGMLIMCLQEHWEARRRAGDEGAVADD